MSKLAQLSSILFLSFQLLACSTMGSVAKGTFIFGTEFYKAQPKVVTDQYPKYFNQTFYTAELFVTDYNEWRLRIVSENDMSNYIESNEIYVDLEYEMDFQTYSKTVPLVFESFSIINVDDKELYAFDFSYSQEGKEFWSEFHELFFLRRKPWFHYPVSPTLPIEVRRYVNSIEYNFVPHWGYLSLRQFMELYRGMQGRRWDEFCFWNNYQYDDSSVCGDIRIEDDPDSIQGAKN
ncbi:hypothetical protein RT723_10690 [Psychrosphaera aquimarina]|uniref:Lipoprotein n=1 Tax=Psychrosphaera aquimarina TaxID=2044854 RepID=A0ABU3R1A2_9GAMM|nr:hypothetical protein [Psychrosphaera aquimarina]MDU0113455.1 hypothetical protein [Psychrosphaera aquimarina]